jgi:hypothetical protein
MSYSEFSLAKAKRDFGLQTVEGGRFLPPTEPIAPSLYLTEALNEGLPLAIATGSEKGQGQPTEIVTLPTVLSAEDVLPGFELQL